MRSSGQTRVEGEPTECILYNCQGPARSHETEEMSRLKETEERHLTATCDPAGMSHQKR